MALNTGHIHQTEEDIISKLNDDVLLSILGRVNLTTAMWASVLSKRWRHLPWLLTELNMDIKDFLCEPHADPAMDNQIDKAMSILTDAVRSMLASTRRINAVTRLCISLFITNNYSSEVGRLVDEAITSGMVRDVVLKSGVTGPPFEVSREDMVKHGGGLNSFFRNYPNLSCCLTTLHLYNATFTESDLQNLLATWVQLRHLFLLQCDTGFAKLFKIDAPNSKLKKLEFAYCASLRVELVCLPQLELLIYGSWSSPYLPLTLGDVPCLKKIEIYSANASYQEPFKLSELLCGTTHINTLSLDFLGQKIWLQQEKDKLHLLFGKLKQLNLHGIFVGFGLSWTSVLFEAAPSLEILDVEVCDHICLDEEKRNDLYGERTNPWEMSEFVHSSKPLPFKELQLRGFNATEEHMEFLGTVMERAPKLQAVILKEQYCKKCWAMSYYSSKSKYPKNEDEQVAVVNNLRNRFSSCAQIVFIDRELYSP